MENQMLENEKLAEIEQRRTRKPKEGIQ